MTIRSGRASLTAADGFQLGAYESIPHTARGGVVVLQEIFGVNKHIRSVCDRFALAGYHAIAPALFDRRARDFESGYSDDEIARNREFLRDIDWDAMLADVAAATHHLTAQSIAVGVVGFCLGGTAAFASALRALPACAVCYYGGGIAARSTERPACPVMAHFGAFDHTITMADVDVVRKNRPEIDLFVYEAGHGFNCDERASYEPRSAALAWDRTLSFLDRFVARPHAANLRD